MNGSDLKKNKPQRCKIGIKNKVKTFYFGDHICTWTVISTKKKVFTLFSNQRAARGFNSFSKSGPSWKKLAQPCSKGIKSLRISQLNRNFLKARSGTRVTHAGTGDIRRQFRDSPSRCATVGSLDWLPSSENWQAEPEKK